MKYFLGIDGGGTKTKICIIDENETIHYIDTGGPSSIDTVSSQTTKNNIGILLSGGIDTIKDEVVFQSVFAGLGGIVTDEDCENTSKLLRPLRGITDKTIITVKNDMENALLSGLCFDEGYAIISGTGAVAFGKDLNGNLHKAGGWGYKEGDAGSSYFVGFKAINATIRAFDDRFEKNDFTDEIAHEIGLSHPFDIVPIMDNYQNERTKIAALAPIVTKHANLGNDLAKKILDENADELVLALKAVYKNIKLKNKILVIVGGLGNSEGYFRDELIKKIKLVDKDIDVIPPKIDPAHAAALMAKRIYSKQSK